MIGWWGRGAGLFLALRGIEWVELAFTDVNRHVNVNGPKKCGHTSS